jgi:NAD(P)-dependent dehydrogenase (short-subunit alcohol dehydrogenase family)
LKVVERYAGDRGEKYLAGKVVVVTGGNAGIGLETCKAMAGAGAEVIMCSRSKDKAIKAIADEIEKMGHGGYVVDAGKITVMELDLQSLASVKSFAQALEKKVKKIDYLVLNAGIMACPYNVLDSGFESQIGVNYFGHYYLVDMLWPRLKKQKSDVRIVELASVAHKFGSVNVSDLHYTNGRAYSPWEAYGQSKLANILHVKALAELAKKEAPHITCFSVHPGVIYTNLTSNMGLLGSIFYKYLASDKTVPQGASTTLYGCLATEIEEVSGAYLVDCAVATPTEKAQDTVTRDKLFEVTKEQLAAATK